MSDDKKPPETPTGFHIHTDGCCEPLAKSGFVCEAVPPDSAGVESELSSVPSTSGHVHVDGCCTGHSSAGTSSMITANEAVEHSHGSKLLTFAVLTAAFFGGYFLMRQHSSESTLQR